jgi:hypothetical protein
MTGNEENPLWIVGLSRAGPATIGDSLRTFHDSHGS